MEVTQKTNSKIGISIIGTKKKINIPVRIGQEYTLSFYYSNLEGNLLNINLFNNNTIEIVNTVQNKNLERIEYNFISLTEELEIEFSSANEGFFYADLMLNEGNTSLPWQPAIGETIGIVVKQNYNGLTIESYLAETKLIANANGFRIVDKANNICLLVDKNKVSTKNIEIDGYAKVGNWITFTQDIKGINYKIENYDS